MEVSPNLLEVKTVAELTEKVYSGESYIAQSDANGSLTKVKFKDLGISIPIQNALNELQAGIVSISPTDAPKANISMYAASVDGTYANFGGIIVTPEDILAGEVRILKNTTGVYSKKIIPVPGLAAYKLKTDPELPIYATIAAANLAIKNEVVNGKNNRDGKIVQIGPAGNYIQYTWKGGFADGNLEIKYSEKITFQIFPTFSGQAFGGATKSDSKITIPAGSTGDNSYYSFNLLEGNASLATDFIGKQVRFEFLIETNLPTTPPYSLLMDNAPRGAFAEVILGAKNGFMYSIIGFETILTADEGAFNVTLQFFNKDPYSETYTIEIKEVTYHAKADTQLSTINVFNQELKRMMDKEVGVLDTKVNSIEIKVEGIVESETGKNLVSIDPNSIQLDKALNMDTGQIVTVVGAILSDYIKVEANEYYTYHGNEYSRIGFYDEAKNVLSGLAEAGVTRTFLTPDNCDSVVVVLKNAGEPDSIMNSVQLEKSTVFTGVEPFKKVVPKESLKNNSYWAGKKFMFFGDSITAANIYQLIIANELGLGYDNNALSGSCVTRGYGHNDGSGVVTALVDRLGGVNAQNYEAIVIFAGTNDYGYGAPLGTINDTGVTTFYGAYRYLLEQLQSQLPAATIFCITPIYGNLGTDRGAGKTNLEVWQDRSLYADAIIQLAGLYSVPVYDAFRNSGIGVNNFNTWLADKIHPNEKGHQKLGRLFSKFIETY